jgi:deoxyribonuclease-4
MIRLGAHMSVSGGVSKAVDRAHLHGCESLQIFTKNASQWRGKPLDPQDVATFRARVADTGIRPVVSHASYLINLATTADALRAQSIAAFVDELDRAEALGLLGVVVHPGTCTAGTEDEGLRLIGEAIQQAFDERPNQSALVLLEHTAGQGRTLGYRFEHLAAIISHVGGSRRIGVCLDTCHLFASGYDIASDAGYRETFDAFDRLVGFGRLKALHGNDSKKPLGSRVDRHEHIGRGCLGEEPFRRLLHDERFAGLPLLLETEKTKISDKPGAIALDPLDQQNLEIDRSVPRHRCRRRPRYGSAKLETACFTRLAPESEQRQLRRVLLGNSQGAQSVPSLVGWPRPSM